MSALKDKLMDLGKKLATAIAEAKPQSYRI